IDWVSGDFGFRDASGFFDVHGVAFDVHLDADCLPGLSKNDSDKGAQGALTLPESHPQTLSPGRPPKWDWEGALAHIVAIANQADGLEGLSNGPFRQADIERAISGWFVSRCDEAPATS